MNEPEPLSAILAEMCELAHGFANGEVCATARKVRQWVSRIEAAADRELSRAAEYAASKANLDRTAKDAAEYLAYAMAHNSAPQGPASAAPAAETLADIVREMRDLGKLDEKSTDKIPRSLMGLSLRTYADRIEAAEKRERVEIRRDAEIEWTRIGYEERKAEERPGNSAAMRDLLETIRHEYGWGRIGCRTCVSSEVDVERVSDLFEKQIDAALSAPARNCDRFATAAEATRAFQVSRGHAVYADACLWDDRDEIGVFIEWLFAPANGGNKQ